MGTSTNYSGSPNWKPVKSETTRAGGEGHVTPEKAASIVSGLVDQMARATQLGFGPTLSTSGSAPSGSRGSGPQGRSGGGGGGGRGGSSRTSGSSARSVAHGLAGFLADVGTKGFSAALSERGLSDLSGKTPDEIALALADVLGGPASLIEETALRDALLELVLEWSEGATELEGLVDSVTAVANNIEAALHDFLGHYIFQVFKTVGYQGVLAAHGFEKAQSMTNEIREFIGAKVGNLESTQSLASIDWNAASGATVIDEIVTQTIEIFGEVEQ